MQKTAPPSSIGTTTTARGTAVLPAARQSAEILARLDKRHSCPAASPEWPRDSRRTTAEDVKVGVNDFGRETEGQHKNEREQDAMPHEAMIEHFTPRKDTERMRSHVLRFIFRPMSAMLRHGQITFRRAGPPTLNPTMPPTEFYLCEAPCRRNCSPPPASV